MILRIAKHLITFNNGKETHGQLYKKLLFVLGNLNIFKLSILSKKENMPVFSYNWYIRSTEARQVKKTLCLSVGLWPFVLLANYLITPFFIDIT